MFVLLLLLAATAQSPDIPVPASRPRVAKTATASVTIVNPEIVDVDATAERQAGKAFRQRRQRDGAPLIEFF
jgi:hypothetical protein